MARKYRYKLTESELSKLSYAQLGSRLMHPEIARSICGTSKQEGLLSENRSDSGRLITNFSKGTVPNFSEDYQVIPAIRQQRIASAGLGIAEAV